MRQSLFRVLLTLGLFACASAAHAQIITPASPPLIAANGVCTADIPMQNVASATVSITGTWAGTLEVRASSNGTDFVVVRAFNQASAAEVASVTGNAILWVPNPGFSAIRVCSTAWTSGTATITATRGFGMASGGGTATIEGGVTIDDVGISSFPDNEPINIAQVAGASPSNTNPFPVRLTDGTNYVATLPVSLASVPSHAVTNAGTFAVQAAQSGTWNIANLVLFGGQAPDFGAGNASTGTLRVILANDSPGGTGGGGSPSPSTDTHSFTTVTSDTAVDVSDQTLKYWSLQVKGTGAAATSWTVTLEVSLDGTNYVPILTHTDTSTSDGGIVAMSTPFPALYYRTRVTALTLGSASAISVTAVGMN